MNSTILEHFKKPVASIDFVKLHLSEYYCSDYERLCDMLLELCKPPGRAHVEALEATGARLEVWSGHVEKYKSAFDYDHLTIHDATPATIRHLVTATPRHIVKELEISLDFFLKDGTNDATKLESLRLELFNSLAPGHGLRRKQFDRSENKYLKPLPGEATTTIYEFAYSGLKVRLYTKVSDNKKPIDTHLVRLEINVSGGTLALAFNPDPEVMYAMQNDKRVLVPEAADHFRVEHLDLFFAAARKFLSPYLFIAAGIDAIPIRIRTNNARKAARQLQANEQQQAKAELAWLESGAAGALRSDGRTPRSRMKLVPDMAMNRVIGRALADFQRRFHVQTVVTTLPRIDVLEPSTKPCEAPAMAASQPIKKPLKPLCIGVFNFTYFKMPVSMPSSVSLSQSIASLFPSTGFGFRQGTSHEFASEASKRWRRTGPAQRSCQHASPSIAHRPVEVSAANRPDPMVIAQPLTQFLKFQELPIRHFATALR